MTLLCAGLLGSCAVGPDFHRPAAPATDRFTPEPLPQEPPGALSSGIETQRFVNGLDIPAQWWTVFRCAQLDTLIRDAIAENPGVREAQAAVRVAVEQARSQRGQYFPSVQASFAASRQRNAVGTLSPTLNSGDQFFDLYAPAVSVTYLFDVFGVNRRQVESLEAQARAQRFQLEATYLTLTSNLVLAAIQEAAIRSQLAATREVAALESEQLEVMRRSVSWGAIPQADVIAQQAALAQVQASIPPLVKQLEQQRVLIRVLTGRLPSDPLPETFELADLQLPAELPVTVPSKLVEQRPDVRAAEEQMHSASAQVGVAIGNLLPQISLNANAGGTSTRIGEVFAGGNTFWAGGATLTQTLFAGGSLWHRKKAAEAYLDQTAAQYRAVVLAAFQDVADSLLAVQHDSLVVSAELDAQRAALESLEIARQQVAKGAASYLWLLNAQQSYQQAVIALAAARAARYADTVALFQSLGGGWWNRVELASQAGSAGPGGIR